MTGRGGVTLNTKKKVAGESIWSDLPGDIVSLITKRLHYVDQIRFRAVCKSWRAAEIEKHADKLPWVMIYDACSCFLYNPYEKRKYTVFKSTNFENFDGAKALEAKYGWVLFSNYKTRSLFFYNPFTNKMIVGVPKLHRSFGAATFSTSPLSPDCMVFVLRVDWPGNYCTIKICKLGDKKWTKYRFKYDNDDFDVYFTSRHQVGFLNAVYVDGVLYCRFPSTIGSFHTARKEWKTHPYPEKRLGWDEDLKDHLIESEGDLLLVYKTIMRGGGGDESCEWNVVRCDPSKMKWLEVERFDNGAFFFGGEITIFVPETGTSKLANTFHYRVASINRVTLFDCPCFNKAKSRQRRPRSPYLPCLYDRNWRCRVDRNGNGLDYFTRDIWIQPPQPRYL